MILSHEHKLIFIKGRKVGGTSVEMALSLVCGPDDIVTPISAADERVRLSLGGAPRNYSDDPAAEARFIEAVRKGRKANSIQPSKLFQNHMSLLEVTDRFPGDLAGYRIIGVSRSPYARLISLANWRRRSEGYTGSSAAVPGTPVPSAFARLKGLLTGTKPSPAASTGLVATDAETIRQYIDDGMAGKVNIQSDVDLYRDRSGAVVAQFLRYETLADDFAKLLKSLGVTRSVSLPHAKKGIMASTLDPRQMLTRQQLDWINTEFADEFEHFGYERV
jgi:hypothetical protein